LGRAKRTKKPRSFVLFFVFFFVVFFFSSVSPSPSVSRTPPLAIGKNPQFICKKNKRKLFVSWKQQEKFFKKKLASPGAAIAQESAHGSAREAHGLIAVCIDDKCSLFRGFFFPFTFSVVFPLAC
jgi:hypothetical protein